MRRKSKHINFYFLVGLKIRNGNEKAQLKKINDELINKKKN